MFVNIGIAGSLAPVGRAAQVVQIAAVVRDWHGPVVYSPGYSDHLGLGGA